MAGNGFTPQNGGPFLWRQVGSFLPWKEVEKTRRNFGTVNEFISKHGKYTLYILETSGNNDWDELARTVFHKHSGGILHWNTHWYDKYPIHDLVCGFVWKLVVYPPIPTIPIRNIGIWGTPFSENPVFTCKLVYISIKYHQIIHQWYFLEWDLIEKIPPYFLEVL